VRLEKTKACYRAFKSRKKAVQLKRIVPCGYTLRGYNICL